MMARKKQTEMAGLIGRQTEIASPAHDVVLHGISPELSGLIVMARKSAAFDMLVDQRVHLAEVNSKLQGLMKSSAKNQGSVMEQYLGMKTALERNMDLIFATFMERK